MLDTNILFSGIVFSGPEAHILDMARDGKFILLIPECILMETRTVILRKMPHYISVLSVFFDTTYFQVIGMPSEAFIRKATELIRDPKDVPQLACALATQPDYLLTGDKDFHTPAINRYLSVVTSSQLLDILDK